MKKKLLSKLLVCALALQTAFASTVSMPANTKKASAALTGKSPFHADRGHLHHKLIDKGFDQKHAVMILYAVSGMLGISAILFSFGWTVKALIVAAAAIAILYGNLNFSFERKDISESQEEQIERDTPDAPAGTDKKA